VKYFTQTRIATLKRKIRESGDFSNIQLQFITNTTIMLKWLSSAQ